MSKQDRLQIIKEIENETNSNVIAYVIGDRQGLAFPIAGDVVRLFYQHLLLFKNIKDKKENISLFLYSRGGHGDVPWQLVPMLREFCNELYVLVPYRAHSAATLIALGADKIIMGKKGELGPVDPSIKSPLNPINPYTEPKEPLAVNVEDITSYLSLLKEKVKLTNQKEIANSFNLLADKVGPLALGNLNRFHSHTSLLIEKLLKTHRSPLNKRKIKHVVANLTEKIFFHGHVISRREAINDIKLNIDFPQESFENLIWDLYLQYEKELRLTESFEPELILGRDSEQQEQRGLIAAYIESVVRTDVCKVDYLISRQRKMPTNVNLNINIPLPPGFDPSRLPPNFMQQLQQQIQQIINTEIRRQAPVVGFQVKKIGGGWEVEG